MGHRSIARVGAAVLTGSVAMLVAAMPALADDPAHGHWVKADKDDHGYSVKMKGEGTLSTSLINLQLDGDHAPQLKTYCVQIEVNLDEQTSMTEQPWDSYPDKTLPFNKNRAKINWVLHNSYPEIEKLDVLATNAGAEFHDGLDKAEAITATQAAIWHFSDGKDFEGVVPGRDGKAPNQDNAADVQSFYDYLIGDKNVGIEENENPSLAISPNSLTGKAGDRLGPFTVKTNGSITELTGELPEGVKITDADGKDIPAGSLKNGSKVYLSVPEDAAAGSAKLNVKANAHFATGRLFVGDNYDKKPSQTLIVATGTDTALSASAKANWTVPTAPAPQGSNGGELANTGASIFVPVLVGVVLVGAGVGALLYTRRRRAS